jgi:hypothetical protein
MKAWALVTCPRCAGATLLETNVSNSVPAEEKRHMPELGATTYIDGVPDDVATYYSEAHIALQAGLTDASAVELRKTLERAAGHFNDHDGTLIDKGKLVDRIKKLIEAGHLPPPFKDALDHVRLIGKIGAHAGEERVEQADLQATLTFTTQTLRNLFEIPHLLAQLDANDDDA